MTNKQSLSYAVQIQDLTLRSSITLLLAVHYLFLSVCRTDFVDANHLRGMRVTANVKRFFKEILIYFHLKNRLYLMLFGSAFR